jgi:hypothetical protein
MKIKFELRMLYIYVWKKKKFRNYRDAFISLKKEQNLEIYQDVIVSSEKSIV